MTQVLFIFSFLVLMITLPSSAQSLKSADKDYVVVTVPEDPEVLKKNKKLRLYRPHLYEDQSGVAFRVTQTSKYPREIKKVRVRYENPEGARETYRFRRDTLQAQMRTGQAQLVDELRREGFASLHKYERALERLNNGHSDPLLRYQWHTLSKTRPTQPGEKVSLRINTGFF